MFHTGVWVSDSEIALCVHQVEQNKYVVTEEESSFSWSEKGED